MADLRITELAALAGGNLSGSDLLAVADISASETKKITVVDLLGNGITLIADATIPGAKIVFGAGTIAGSAIANGGISATQLADDAVTAAKLGNESTVDLVTTLPVSGAFIGQIALNTDDNKAYIWNGSAWTSFKAAGSINSAVASSAGIINITVTTSGDQITIGTSLDDSTAAAQFLAGPTASAGAVSYRQIASGDMPTASSTGKGAVLVDGAGIAMTGDQIVIDNTVAASGATYSVVQYNDKGLVVDGRFITAADLPEATSVDKGAVVPGTGLSVVAGGALNHTNNIVAGTAAKITFDAEGHVTASQSLLDTDIPELPASKLTSGTISASVIGTNTISGDKLANASTTKFGGTASTDGIVSFPTADFTGQYFFDSINGDLYLWDGNAWQPITITAGEIIFAGTYNANTNLIASVTTAGTALGLTVGSGLPAATDANTRYYVVVSVAGTGTAPAPAVALAPPDMLVSNGTTWEEVDVSTTVTAQLASNVSFSPTGTISSNNVQTALAELDTEKLAVAGGTVTGELLIGATGSLVLEGSTADGFETTIAVVDPTADRTITLPDRTGTVITTGDTDTVTNTMLAGSIAYSKLSLAGAILNADINASAAIAYSKLTLTGSIVNADINASAAIAGTKIAPNFGSQTVSTTGNFRADRFENSEANEAIILDPSNDSIQFVSNDIERARIDSQGRVGVGTTSPAALLNVASADTSTTPSADADEVLIEGTGNTGISLFCGLNSKNNIYFGENTVGISRGAIVYDTSNDSFAFSTNGLANERVRIDSSGNVGIGTTSPAALLSVSAATATGIGSRLNIENTESSATIDIIATGTAFSAPGWATVTDGAIIRSGAGGSGGLALQAGSNAPISFWGSTSERMRIDNANRLLVGTSDAVSLNNGIFAGLELHALTTGNGASASIARLGNDGSAGPQLNLGKSRSGTLSPGGIVVENDVLGEISFCGDDGTDINSAAAKIYAQVDGTPGTNDMPGRLVFSTTPDGFSLPSERMRITSNGTLYYGTTLEIFASSSASSGLGLNITSDGGILGKTTQAVGSVFFEQNITSYTSGTVIYQRFRTNGNIIGSIASVNGTSTAYNTSSDYRLKENIIPLTGAIDRVNQLQVHRFNFIADPDTVVDGFIAHEAQAVVPECVTGEKDKEDENGDPIYQGIDQSKLVPLLTAALQEAIAEINALKARVAALELN